ncbi:MAG: hypothetical protein U9N54_06250 [candidate division Zixibacteria bacterium]|nr:hypothetical protein [candidate division Zixibacteria bacterium]
MEYISNGYGLLLLFGIIALIVVGVITYNHKNNLRPKVGRTVVKTNTEVIDKAGELVELNSNSLKEYLTPLRNDQPVFMHVVANLLERTKKSSEIKVIHAVTKQLEAQSELLSKIDEYEEQIHTLTRKKDNFRQRDEMQDLKHNRDKKRILNEIENLADEAGGREKSRKRELKNLEAELTHEYAKKRVENRLASIDDREKNAQKTRQFNDMRDVFNIEYEAIKNNKTLTPAVKKETLRTLERTFIAQLDEFTEGL